MQLKYKNDGLYTKFVPINAHSLYIDVTNIIYNCTKILMRRRSSMTLVNSYEYYKYFLKCSSLFHNHIPVYRGLYYYCNTRDVAHLHLHVTTTTKKMIRWVLFLVFWIIQGHYTIGWKWQLKIPLFVIGERPCWKLNIYI